MGIQIKLILASCIVHFGFMSVQLHNARNQVQNLFHSIARSDTKKSEIYHEILKQDVVKEQQAFDTIRKELRVAQNRNAYKRSNFYKEDDVSQTVVAVKRDTKQNHGEYDPRKIDEVEYEYEYVTAEYAKEVNATMLREPVQYLCRLPDKERIKICKEALEHKFAIEHGIKYVETERLGEAKMYAFRINSGPYLVDCPIIMSACTCPTSPTIYLRNKFEGFNVQAYMVLPGAAGEWKTTTGYETNTMLGPDISAAQIFQ